MAGKNRPSENSDAMDLCAFQIYNFNRIIVNVKWTTICQNIINVIYHLWNIGKSRWINKQTNARKIGIVVVIGQLKICLKNIERGIHSPNNHLTFSFKSVFTFSRLVQWTRLKIEKKQIPYLIARLTGIINQNILPMF